MVVKDPKTRKRPKRKGKPLTPEELRLKRSELVREAAKLVIELHRDALKELARQ
jgi:hypothetical protein